jgi:TRAP-type C4-dicarboxylate transport system permease small subunit
MIKQALTLYSSVMSVINTVVGIVAALILATSFGVMVMEVISRYFLRLSYGWVLEYARYGLIYVVFLAGSILFYKGEHISITMLSDKLPPKVVEILLLLINVVVIYFLTLVLRSGWVYAQMGAGVPSTSRMTTLIVPRMAVPIGAVLMILQVLNNMFLGIEKLLTYTPEKWQELKEEKKTHEEKVIEETVEELEEIERLKAEAQDDDKSE